MSAQRFTHSFTDDSAPEALMKLADDNLARGAQSLLLLAADANDCRPESLDPWLQSLPVPVCGGVFPQLIHSGHNHSTGYVVVGMPDAVNVNHVAGLSDPGADYFSAVETLFADSSLPQSLLILVDGLARRIGDLLEGVYDILGSRPIYFGGGAGSLSFQAKPCLFSNQGMLQDQAQIVTLPWRLNLAVEHGWQRFQGPFVVTQAANNVITALDFQPAFAAYREHVEAHSGTKFTEDNFFSIAKGYPFGLIKPDGRMVVRDPIAVEGNDLICVGEVPANSVVCLLRGEPAQLIAAAQQAAAQMPDGHGPAFLADCISRVLYLGDEFGDELTALQKGLGNRPLLGMLTLGEIANGGDNCLEFYNKTVVLATLSD